MVCFLKAAIVLARFSGIDKYRARASRASEWLYRMALPAEQPISADFDIDLTK